MCTPVVSVNGIKSASFVNGKIVCTTHDDKTFVTKLFNFASEVVKSLLHTFFAAKEKAVGGEKQIENENLQKKQEIIDRLNTLKENIDEVTPNQIHAIRAEWNAIGHVPFKEKDKIFDQYQKALDIFYQKIDMKGNKARMNAYAENVSKMATGEKAQNNLMREREKLMRAYERMTTELKTYENNIGFLSLSSKGGNSLIREIEKKKEALKADIRTVVEKIELIDKNL